MLDTILQWCKLSQWLNAFSGFRMSRVVFLYFLMEVQGKHAEISHSCGFWSLAKASLTFMCHSNLTQTFCCAMKQPDSLVNNRSKGYLLCCDMKILCFSNVNSYVCIYGSGNILSEILRTFIFLKHKRFALIFFCLPNSESNHITTSL
jgi:hypothetical protein